MGKVTVRISLASGCEKPTQKDGYRVRVGDYRILYKIIKPADLNLSTRHAS